MKQTPSATVIPEASPLRTDPERPDLRYCLSYHPAPTLLHLPLLPFYQCQILPQTCMSPTAVRLHPIIASTMPPHQHFRHCATTISITYHCHTPSLPVPVTHVLSPLSYHNWHAQSPSCPTTAIFLTSPFGSWATSFAAPGHCSTVDLAV